MAYLGKYGFARYCRAKKPGDYQAAKRRKRSRGVKIPVLTERQMAIMTGSAPAVRKNEVNHLIEKLLLMELKNDAEKVREQYQYLFSPYPTIPPRYTSDESEGLLQSITPWRLPVKEVAKVDQTDTLYERLNAAVLGSGLSRKEICERTGISKANLSRYLAGKMMPREKAVNALANALNVDAEWLSGKANGGINAGDLVVLFNRLDNTDRKRLLGLAKAMLKETRYLSVDTNKAGH